jgi:biopolymer transport protein ExbB/TolQ
MTRSQGPVADLPIRRERRRRTTLAAFIIGVPLATAILALVHYGPLRNTSASRYLSHSVEYVELLMFCGALGALATKYYGSIIERRACGLTIVPPWDGKTVPVAEAGRILASLNQLGTRIQGTVIVKRTAAVLGFLCSRGSAAELDDHLRSLSDTDALALEGSYSLTRFITWAIPILGFLGTVLGITKSIHGVTPEVLEKDLSQVTNGLALAFDATALALALTMVTMFLSSLVERAEQSILDHVDRYVDHELAHRFERADGEAGVVVAVVQKQTETLIQGVEQVVQEQARIWADALHEGDRRRQEAEVRQQQSFTAALQAALEKTLETHARRLATLENQVAAQSAELVQQLSAVAHAVQQMAREQQAAAAQISQGIAGQIDVLNELHEGERNLRRLQETLNQNLSAIAGTDAFEQALHSLTAAVHLLTARVTPGPASNRLGTRPGTAA